MTFKVSGDRIHLTNEQDRQIDLLTSLGYPQIASVGSRVFFKNVKILRRAVQKLPWKDANMDKGGLPFVIVIPDGWVRTEKAIRLAGGSHRQLYIDMYPHRPNEFHSLSSITTPPVAYLAVDIERGGRCNGVNHVMPCNASSDENALR